ncbi:Myosin 10A, isoform D [Lobulomyces angularis]|nr:Myosin 10A, isoform D [Lobulomyces angularis]
MQIDSALESPLSVLECRSYSLDRSFSSSISNSINHFSSSDESEASTNLKRSSLTSQVKKKKLSWKEMFLASTTRSPKSSLLNPNRTNIPHIASPKQSLNFSPRLSIDFLNEKILDLDRQSISSNASTSSIRKLKMKFFKNQQKSFNDNNSVATSANGFVQCASKEQKKNKKDIHIFHTGIGGVLEENKWNEFTSNEIDFQYCLDNGFGKLKENNEKILVLDLSKLSSSEISRQEIMYELYVTEKEYIRDLRIIINVFLIEMEDRNIATEKETKIIFSNLGRLLPLHDILLDQLEKNRICGLFTNVGEIFLDMKLMKLEYTYYCANYPESTEFIQEKKLSNGEFQLFLQFCQLKPECRNLELSAFLLKPIQRIMKYPLLIQQLLNHTPEDHSEYSVLTKAYDNIKKVVENVNEKKKDIETLLKYTKVLSRLEFNAFLSTKNKTSRIVLLDGILTKHSNKKIVSTSIRTYCILFSDCFVVSTYSGKTNNFDLSAGFCKILFLGHIHEITEVKDRGHEKDRHEFSVTIQSEPKDIVLRFSTPTFREKNIWINTIQNLLAKELHNKNTSSTRYTTKYIDDDLESHIESNVEKYSAVGYNLPMQRSFSPPPRQKKIKQSKHNSKQSSIFSDIKSDTDYSNCNLSSRYSIGDSGVDVHFSKSPTPKPSLLRSSVDFVEDLNQQLLTNNSNSIVHIDLIKGMEGLGEAPPPRLDSLQERQAEVKEKVLVEEKQNKSEQSILSSGCELPFTRDDPAISSSECSEVKSRVESINSQFKNDDKMQTLKHIELDEVASKIREDATKTDLNAESCETVNATSSLESRNECKLQLQSETLSVHEINEKIDAAPELIQNYGYEENNSINDIIKENIDTVEVTVSANEMEVTVFNYVNDKLVEKVVDENDKKAIEEVSLNANSQVIEDTEIPEPIKENGTSNIYNNDICQGEPSKVKVLRTNLISRNNTEMEIGSKKKEFTATSSISVKDRLKFFESSAEKQTQYISSSPMKVTSQKFNNSASRINMNNSSVASTSIRRKQEEFLKKPSSLGSQNLNIKKQLINSTVHSANLELVKTRKKTEAGLPQEFGTLYARTEKKVYRKEAGLLNTASMKETSNSSLDTSRVIFPDEKSFSRNSSLEKSSQNTAGEKQFTSTSNEKQSNQSLLREKSPTRGFIRQKSPTRIPIHEKSSKPLARGNVPLPGKLHEKPAIKGNSSEKTSTSTNLIRENPSTKIFALSSAINPNHNSIVKVGSKSRTSLTTVELKGMEGAKTKYTPLTNKPVIYSKVELTKPTITKNKSNVSSKLDNAASNSNKSNSGWNTSKKLIKKNNDVDSQQFALQNTKILLQAEQASKRKTYNLSNNTATKSTTVKSFKLPDSNSANFKPFSTSKSSTVKNFKLPTSGQI